MVNKLVGWVVWLCGSCDVCGDQSCDYINEFVVIWDVLCSVLYSFGVPSNIFAHNIFFFFWIHCSVVSFDHVSFVQLHGIIEALLIVQLAGLLCTYGCKGIWFWLHISYLGLLWFVVIAFLASLGCFCMFFV